MSTAAGSTPKNDPFFVIRNDTSKHDVDGSPCVLVQHPNHTENTHLNLFGPPLTRENDTAKHAVDGSPCVVVQHPNHTENTHLNLFGPPLPRENRAVPPPLIDDMIRQCECRPTARLHHDTQTTLFGEPDALPKPALLSEDTFENLFGDGVPKVHSKQAKEDTQENLFGARVDLTKVVSPTEDTQEKLFGPAPQVCPKSRSAVEDTQMNIFGKAPVIAPKHAREDTHAHLFGALVSRQEPKTNAEIDGSNANSLKSTTRPLCSAKPLREDTFSHVFGAQVEPPPTCPPSRPARENTHDKLFGALPETKQRASREDTHANLFAGSEERTELPPTRTRPAAMSSRKRQEDTQSRLFGTTVLHSRACKRQDEDTHSRLFGWANKSSNCGSDPNDVSNAAIDVCAENGVEPLADDIPTALTTDPVGTPTDISYTVCTAAPDSCLTKSDVPTIPVTQDAPEELPARSSAAVADVSMATKENVDNVSPRNVCVPAVRQRPPPGGYSHKLW